MFDTAINITELPWATVLTLASGYCGYFIAHQGVRDHHQTADVTFGTLAFGFWGLAVYRILLSLECEWIDGGIATIAGFATSVVAGGFWAKWGRSWMGKFLHDYKISLLDDCPSAWAALGRESKANAYQLTVKMASGDVYCCDNLSQFRDLPNGPCTIGGRGDVLMYATHVKKAGSEEFTRRNNLESSEWGTEILYLPKEQIQWLKLRQR